MKRKKFHPYLLPLIKNYTNTKFLEESKIILDFLKKTVIQTVWAAEDETWIYVHGEKPKKINRPEKPWMPKLYLCVKPQFYWPLVFELFTLCQRETFSWKFCKDLSMFGRADKIVIYANSEKDLKNIYSKVQPLIKDKKTHSLRFAQPTKQNGIFLGCDPTFLKKSSWRYYRWLLGEALIKPNLQNGKLDKDTRLALDALNISLKHDGPKSLNPKSKNIKFIKQVWRKINS